MARAELSRLKGPLYAKVAVAVGKDYVDKNIRTWEAMQKVLDSGEHRPTHLRGWKPDGNDSRLCGDRLRTMKTATLDLDAEELDRKRDAERKGRKASKETRRQQLIEATIDLLAKRGYSETTMADVADGAGLSRGIVNFHFESKEKLLVATLQYMADEYSQHWRARAAEGRRRSGKAAADAGRGRFRPLDLHQAQARRMVRLLGRGEIAADLSGAVRRARRGLPERLHRALPDAEEGWRL